MHLNSHRSPRDGPQTFELCQTSPSYLVRLVTEVAAERLGSRVRGLVFVQQGGASAHLVAGEALVKFLWVELLDVLPMLLQRREAQAALLTVMGLRQV